MLRRDDFCSVGLQSTSLDMVDNSSASSAEFKSRFIALVTKSDCYSYWDITGGRHVKPKV